MGDSRRFDNDLKDNLAPRAQTSVSRSRGAEICIREPTSSHREALGRIAYKRKLIVDRFLETRSPPLCVSLKLIIPVERIFFIAVRHQTQVGRTVVQTALQ